MPTYTLCNVKIKKNDNIINEFTLISQSALEMIKNLKESGKWKKAKTPSGHYIFYNDQKEKIIFMFI